MPQRVRCPVVPQKTGLRIVCGRSKKDKSFMRGRFECDICRRTFNLRNDLIKHNKDMHLDLLQMIREGAKNAPQQCKQCESLHWKKHECMFQPGESITQWLDRKKTREKEMAGHFKCGLCVRIFNTKNQLVRHNQMLHRDPLQLIERKNDDAPNICNECGALYPKGEEHKCPFSVGEAEATGEDEVGEKSEGQGGNESS